MKQAAIRRLRLHPEEASSGRALADFFFSCFADKGHAQAEPQGYSCQRMVAVQHDVLRVDFGDGVEHVLPRIRIHAFGKRVPLYRHAFLEFGREKLARLQENQLVVVVAKGLFRFQVQVDLRARFMTLKRLLDFREEVGAANEKFHRRLQHVQNFAKCVLERPGQAHDALLSDFHRRIVAAKTCDIKDQEARNPMDVDQPLPLLAGLSPRQFMKRYWQKKPLLVRQAISGFKPVLDRAALFDLAGGESVESRVVVHGAKGWTMRKGPFKRRSLPPVKQPGWTLLVQGVDLHDDAVHALLKQFRFVPDARLDDLMISYATDRGGVGPHVDSYDVFLLQAHGERRWRISKQQDMSLVAGVPLKILANFEAQQEFVLGPGDMLYLPPGYAHDGIAQGECMTYSVGFRAPARGELARELLQRIAEDAEDAAGMTLYRDGSQPPVESPGAVPASLVDFAQHALQAVLADRDMLPRAMGEYLTEPKSNVWFDAPESSPEVDGGQELVLDRRTRMMHDARHVFINGESYRAAGRDATLMRRLADTRRLDTRDLAGASEDARSLLSTWLEAGWLHGS